MSSCVFPDILRSCLCPRNTHFKTQLRKDSLNLQCSTFGMQTASQESPYKQKELIYLFFLAKSFPFKTRKEFKYKKMQIQT